MRGYINGFFNNIMTEYIWLDSQQVPIIRIGKGSSKFYANLLRSYSKNYDIIQMLAVGARVNLAIWLVFHLSKEFHISSVYISWATNTPTISFLVYNTMPPVDVPTIDLNDGDFYIKYGKKTSNEVLQRLLVNKQHASIITAGASCVDLLTELPLLYTIGYIYYTIAIVRTFDKDEEKAGIKVSVVPYNNALFQMQQEAVQAQPMQEMLPEAV